jgi:hypothetical protein
MGQGQTDGQHDEDLDIDTSGDTGTSGDGAGPGDDTGESGNGSTGSTGGSQQSGGATAGQQQRTQPLAPRPAPPRTPPAPAGGQEWTPPTREQWERSEDRRKIAEKEARDRKERLRKIELESATDAERREAELTERTRTETEGTWRPRVIAAEARAALSGAGCRSEDVTRLVKLIDRDQVEVGEDGTVSGINEQVQDLAHRYPEFFKAKRATPAGGPQPQPGDDGVVQPGPGRAPAQNLSTTERQAAALTGRRTH